MTQLSEHPTVKKFYVNKESIIKPVQKNKLDAEWLRELCFEAGADDLGFVEIDRKEIADQREDIRAAFPRTKTLVSIAYRMNRDSIRTLAHSVADNEFHYMEDHIKEVARKIVSALEEKGVWAVSVSGLFPMAMERWPEKPWDVSLKPVAVAAGLGQMGHHRLVIHPKFGSFMNLSAILIDSEVSAYDRPIDYNPCLECKTCVATCPTGAVGSDGHFNFSACITHNYREKMGGFTDWVENIAQSKSAKDYRSRISDSETVSMWQSLGYEANTKCDYCMAVCPAGEDVIGPFLLDRKGVLGDIVKPLQKKEEKVYVVPGSDAEAHVSHRFPHKTVRRVGNGLRPTSIKAFLGALPIMFQRGQSEGLNITYHFTFTGEEETEATVVIKDKSIVVRGGHIGKPDIHVTADSRTWIGFFAKEKGIVWALLRRKIRIKGSPRLLSAFGRCFPS